MNSFEIEVPGKWILAGEHAVLRGQPAIALPHKDYSLNLKFERNLESNQLDIYPPSIESEVRHLIGYLETNGPKHCFSGSLQLSSTIPLGAGFGSSAAFCYALAAWFRAPLSLEKEKLVEIASRLEDHYHGKSSGLDVAVVASQKPIVYRRGHPPVPLALSTLPRFTFHDTGVRATTQSCIAKVESFVAKHAALATRYDEQMGMCTTRLSEALVAFSHRADQRPALRSQIAVAMNQAQECFYAWDLVPDEAKQLEDKLKAQGARGIKITGAGGGGFLVALWDE